ncbi:MAG TPA: hypothetical protein VNH11_20040 [Pirellulales bacterium]|nr:hypothetical protein [Pirellulales bacterium]
MSEGYFKRLTTECGRGWTRFWFAPSDPIALGGLRIGVGLIALYWLATFTPDLDRYFGAHGLVPLGTLRQLEEPTRDGNRQTAPEQVREAMPREYRFSYLDHVRSPGGLLAAHLAGMAAVALFTCGVFTPVSSIATLVVVLSYLHRGPMLTSQVEPLMAFVLLYLCLGPSGSACSVDRWRKERRTPGSLPAGSIGPLVARSSTWATVSLRLIQVHLTLVYAMMAVGKLGGHGQGDNVWWSGMGMWYLIARTEQRMLDLTALHQWPLLVHAGSYAVMFWQAAFPIFVWNRLARPLMLGINAVMWALLAPILGNIPFAVMMIVASLAFVAPEKLRAVVSRRRTHEAALPAKAAA